MKRGYSTTFIIISVLSGWFGVFINHILGAEQNGNSLGMLIWLVLPFVTAIFLRTIKKDLKNNCFALHLRGNLKWYLFAILFYWISGIINIAICMVTKTVTIHLPETSIILSVIFTAIAQQLLKNIFEEYSWRGYLTQKLSEERINDWLLYLIVGIVWCLWHLPYYLIFLDKSMLGEFSRGSLIASSFVILISWSIMYVELYRITFSVWPCVILHAMTNVIQGVFFGVDSQITYTSNIMSLLFHPINGIIATILCIICGLAMRRYRIRTTLLMSGGK